VAVRRPFAVLAATMAVVLAVVSSVAFASGASAETAPSDTGGGMVWSEVRKPDGTSTATVYTAAAGVTVAALYQSLRSAGVPGLVDPATRSQQSFAAVSCSYGRVDTLTCAPVRWNKRGFDDPQVYFRDSSGSAWPVSASVTEWNRAVGADSYYIWYANGSCPAASTGRHCVPVTSAYYGSNWIGRIDYSYDANRYFIDGSVRVYLNSSHGPAEDYRSVACAQLGHTLGIGHNDASNSCMYSTRVPGPDARYPNSDDFGLIRYALYPD
jgi:hypothetical protein